MNKKQIVDTIASCCEEFQFKGAIDDGGMYLVRKKVDAIEKIVIQYARTEGVIEMDPNILAYKSFKVLDDILLKHAKVHDVGALKHTIRKRIGNTPSDEGIMVYDRDWLIKEIDRVLKDRIAQAVEYFEKWTNVRDVYNHAMSLSVDDISGFMSHGFPLRLLIMKAMFREPDYEQYNAKVYEVFSESAEQGNQPTADHFKLVPDLFKELDDMYKDK